MDLKVALVTGASSGIGRAVAAELVQAGYKVYGSYRSKSPTTPGIPEGVIPVSLDITDPASCKAAVEKILQESGRIDLLVNNAGYGQMGALADLSDEQLTKQLDTNLAGMHRITQLVIPCMTERRSGTIANVSSISGVMPSVFSGAYCASKAAVNAWSDTLRMELKPFGIRVITIQPGAIRSHFGDNAVKYTALPAGSLYSAVSESVLKRASISQQGATPAEAFARKLVKKLLRRNPPSIIRIGKSSFLYPLLKRWLPSRMLDRIIMKTFGLSKLRA